MNNRNSRNKNQHGNLNHDLVLRDYQPGDLTVCIEVFNSNIPTYFAEIERAEYLEFLRDPEDRQHYLVLELDHKIVACGGYYVVPNESRGGLSFGVVTRALHGRGLGKRLLLERLYRLIKIFEVKEIALDTSQPVFGFFQKLGFVIEKITPDGYTLGLDRYDMKLLLDDKARERIQAAYEDVLVSRQT